MLQVQQSAMLVPMEQVTAQLMHILADHRASDPNHKVTCNSQYMHPLALYVLCQFPNCAFISTCAWVHSCRDQSQVCAGVSMVGVNSCLVVHSRFTEG